MLLVNGLRNACRMLENFSAIMVMVFCAVWPDDCHFNEDIHLEVALLTKQQPNPSTERGLIFTSTGIFFFYYYLYVLILLSRYSPVADRWTAMRVIGFRL